MNRLRWLAARGLAWMGQLCEAASAWLAPDEMTPTELQEHLNRAIQWITVRREHACAECSGAGFVRTPDGTTEICAVYQGTCLDPGRLAEQAQTW